MPRRRIGIVAGPAPIRWFVTVVCLAVPFVLVGCRSTTPIPADPATEASPGQGTFVFGASVDPVALDPALVTDPDSVRITRQIFETLVNPSDQPGLATSWEAANGDRTWTFTLREGVAFHDDTTFDATAVCSNVDRWWTLTGPSTDPGVSGVFQEVFGGSIDDPDTRLQGCTVLDAHRVRLDLTEPRPDLPTELARPQFAIQSPAALATHGAYGAGDLRTSSYATAHPTGTGPFRFGAWEPDNQIVLVRNTDYWGVEAGVERAVIKTISDPKARAEQLLKGDIDAYDQVSALDEPDLAAAPEGEATLQSRARRNVTYLGMSADSEALSDPRIRRAVAYAIDPSAVLAVMPSGSTAADGVLIGDPGSSDATGYDPTKARRLLAEAGATHLTLKLAYPSGVTQGYLPSPEDLYAVIADQLEAVGITVEPDATSWPTHLSRLGSSDADRPADLHLMGVAMVDDDPTSTVTQLLAGGDVEFGLDATRVTDALEGIERLSAGATRTAEAEDAATGLLTGPADPVVVPLAFPTEQVALGQGVRDYPVDPYAAEVWTGVRVTP